MNRYAFAGGNPISFVELDGHRYIVADGVYAHSITGKIVEDRSSSTASGSGGDSSGYGLRDFGKDVGGFFVGLWEGFSETVTGIYQSGCLTAGSPVLAMVGPGINACAETVSNTVSYALTDPKGFGLALWHGTTDPIVDDWNSGNYGEAIGRGIFAIAELALGTKGATKLGSLAKSNLRGMGNILRSERGSISFGGPVQPKRIYSARELVRSAKDSGPHHNFPVAFDDVIFNEGKREVIRNFWKKSRPGLSNDSVNYTLRGFRNGQRGRYEIFTRPSLSGRIEIIMHRFFRPDKP